MAKVKFKKGKKELSIQIDSSNFIKNLSGHFKPSSLTENEILKEAMENPIGTPLLEDIVKPGEKIVIITSDITRPMPTKRVLPFVLSTLRKAGIHDKDITIILALGSHRKHTLKEKTYILGETVIDSKISVLDHEMNQCKRLGVCKNGTPVDVYKEVLKGDRIICLGNIDYHYFAGYSGGIKAVMPGVSSWEAIQANHSNMIKPEAHAGNLTTNPVRLDIDEVSKYLKVDFILNVILDEHKKIIKAVTGDVIKAHRQGCRYLDDIYGVPIEKQGDIVIVSPGGYPKDINLYQSQKALDNSKHALRAGGIIILVASASEGFGEENFENWMLNKSPEEMIYEIKNNFILGGHKAAAIGRILMRNNVYFVSDLNDELVGEIGFKPYHSIDEALRDAYKVLGNDSQVYTIPYGGSILPIIKK